MKPFPILAALLAGLLTAPALGAPFTFSTPVHASGSPPAGLSTILDSVGQTHLVWVTSEGDGEHVWYARYDNDQQIAPVEVAAAEGPWFQVTSVAITVDSQDRAQVVWHVEREDVSGAPTGNYAVYHAGDTSGAGDFAVEQVSTNSTAPEDDDAGDFHAAHEDRPSIAVDADDEVHILYLAYQEDAVDPEWIIQAQRPVDGDWTRRMAYTLDFSSEFERDYDWDPSAGAQMPPRLTGGRYFGFIERRFSDIFFAHDSGGGWFDERIAGFEGNDRNHHLQVDVTDSGSVHLLWFDVGTDPDSFRTTTLSGTSAEAVDQIPAPDNAEGGLHPMAVDRVTGLRHLVWDTPSQRFMLIETSADQFETVELDPAGAPLGQRALNVSNGAWTLVTASEADGEIHIHTEALPIEDTTPDAFAFTDVDGVEPSTTVTSEPVTISGIDAAAEISVTGGSYSIGCSEAFTAATGTIDNGEVVCVRHTAAATTSTQTDTTLTVGGVSDTFSSVTQTGGGDDTTPDAFSFPDKTGVEPSTTVTSARVTITGIDTPAPISVSGGTYSIGCDATFKTGSSTILNNQRVCVRHESAAAFSTDTTTILTVGGVSGTFTSTTQNDPSDDATPIDIGSPVTVSGQENDVLLFSVEVPEGVARLTITTSDGSGDIDIEVNGPPGASCASENDGTSDESCSIANPPAGEYLIDIFAFEDFSGVRLLVTITAPSGGGGGGGGWPPSALVLLGLASLWRRRHRCRA